VTGVVVDRPAEVADVADALAGLLRSQPLRQQMSIESRERVIKEFTYEDLSRRLSEVLTHPVPR